LFGANTCPRTSAHRHSARDGRTVRVALDRDGRNGDDGTFAEPLLQFGVCRFAVGQAEPPPVVVDHDLDVIRVVEGRCARLPVQRRYRAPAVRTARRVAPPIATHSSEIQYLFDQPNTPVPATLDAGQEALAAGMRAARANFAAAGDPSSAAVPWPSFDDGARVLSLVQPQPRVETNFASIHHCAFWGVG